MLQWLVEAADQLQAFSRHFLCDLHVRQVQWDELYAVLSAVKAGKRSEAQAITRLSRSPDWVWTAMDPESTLLLSIDVGERTLAMAQDVVHQVTRVLAPDCAPLFLTDGFREYMTALLSHYGHWVQQPRRQGPGPMPKPRWMPLPQLLYAQVVKTLRRRRIIAVTHRVVFGTKAAVEQGGVCRSSRQAKGVRCIPVLGLHCAGNAAESGAIDEVPEQRAQRGRQTAQGHTKDLDAQHRRHDELGDEPYESCPEHTLQYWWSRGGSGRQPYIPQREDHTPAEKVCEQARSTGVSRDGRYVHGLTDYHGCHTIDHDRLQQRS